MNLLENMVRKYPLQKTLCFELCPIGKTKENLENIQSFESDSILSSLFLSFDHFKKDKIVEEAQQRSDDFREIKHLIDPVHIKIIEDSLNRLSNDSEFVKLLSSYKVFEVVENNKKNKNNKKYNQDKLPKEIQKNIEIQKDITKKVKEFLTENEQFKQMFFDERLQFRTSNKKELDELKKKFFDKKCKLLQEHYKDEPAKVELLKHFADFMSYFDSYDNRVRKLYESEEKISTIYKSIPYRLITDNLPIFYVNTLKLNKIAKAEGLKIVLPDENIKYVDKFSLYLTNSSIKKYNRTIVKINTVISNYNCKHDKKLSHLGKLGLLVDLEQDFDILKRISDDQELVSIINEFINRIKFQSKDNIENFKNLFKNLDKTYDIDKLYIRNNKIVKDIFVTEIKEILRKENKSILVSKYKIPNNGKDIGFEDVLKYILKVKYNISNNSNADDIIKLYFNPQKKSNPKNIQIKDRLKNEIKEIFRAEYKISNDDKDDKKDDILRPCQHVKFGNIQDSYVSFEEIKDKIANIKKDDSAEVQAIKNRIKGKIFLAISNKANKLFDTYLEKYEAVKDILNDTYKSGIKILESKDPKNIVKIKEFLDSIKEISDFVSYFIPKNPENRDFLDFYKANFDIYNKFNPEKLAKINQIYAHVKAYFTLKNFSTKKIRLNFNADLFLDSWDIDDLDETLGTILLKEEAGQTKYFLGIGNREDFAEKFKEQKDVKDSYYRQMLYKYIPASKNNVQKRKIDFRNISADCINNMVDKGELYLFQIYRKDFSKYSNGNFKLHTMYWNNIFDKDNLEKEHVFSISGEARIFHRAKSLTEGKIIHKANESIKNKNVNNPKKESTFTYDLIKDRRYTEDKLMFHVPIAINYSAKEMTQKEFNTIINKRIREIQKNAKNDKKQEGVKGVNVIAVTRAEKELLYFVVIDSNGEVIDYGPLNKIKTKANNDDKNIVLTDYKDQFSVKEAEHKKANEENNVGKEWKSERSIKDFLAGYISQAVNEIVKLVKKYNAIVVFEDLEANSEKIDSIIDKSLYYKFQKALIVKLSYLADKHIEDEDKLVSKFKEGSTFNGYQLAYYDEEKISNEKQNGIVFYVPTTLTTNIDPRTGFMNCFSNKLSSAPSDVKDFLSRFGVKNNKEIIVYDEEKQYYKFTFAYKNFLYKGRNDKGRYIEEDKDSNNFIYLNNLYKKLQKDDWPWTICSYGKRIEKVKTEQKDPKTGKFTFKYREVNITAGTTDGKNDGFDNLFSKYNIKKTGRGLYQNIMNFLDDPDNSFAPQHKGMNRSSNSQNQKSPKESFCEEFMRLFKLMIKMKNSNLDTDTTYIISPVEKDGVFYDSRNFTEFVEKEQSSSIEENLDESGSRAYNIAKKGLMILKKIEDEKVNINDIDLTLNDEEWIEFGEDISRM